MNCFKNKRVAITGHTGFKGSWLSAWCKQLNAEVFGISDNIPTKPAHVSILEKAVDHDLRLDVRDRDEIVEIS